ncbi:hypothetical protein K1719_024494 [Acacia pycnantha]|nr:hypothetical protein K1719_024494 [Acacia pycnantha]
MQNGTSLVNGDFLVLSSQKLVAVSARMETQVGLLVDSSRDRRRQLPLDQSALEKRKRADSGVSVVVVDSCRERKQRRQGKKAL